MATVLWIADEESLLDPRKQALQSSGFSVLTASSRTDALNTFASHRVDAVVLDCARPDTPCAGTPVPIKQLKPRTPLILLSPNRPVANALSTAVDVFIQKENESINLLLGRLKSLIRLRSHSHAELEHEYVIFADSARLYLDCSDGVCELLGYPRMELIGMSIDDVSYVPERVPSLFEKFVHRGEQSGEYILRHKSGKPVLIQYRSYAFDDGCLAAVWEPIQGWRQLYSAALVEVDPVKLKERVGAAQLAIEERVRELTGKHGTTGEWQALQDALAGIKVLSREFPT
jgi:CheY-like chemotaxis protein